MATVFKVGDAVMLNVGGPAMAVSVVLSSTSSEKGIQRYRCQWFAGKKLDSGDFPEDSLVAAPVASAAPGSGS